MVQNKNRSLFSNSAAKTKRIDFELEKNGSLFNLWQLI